MSDSDRDAFVARIGKGFAGAQPVNVADAIRAVLATVSRHVPAGEVENVRSSLPEELRALWPTPEEACTMSARTRCTESRRDARYSPFAST